MKKIAVHSAARFLEVNREEFLEFFFCGIFPPFSPRGSAPSFSACRVDLLFHMSAVKQMSNFLFTGSHLFVT